MPMRFCAKAWDWTLSFRLTAPAPMLAAATAVPDLTLVNAVPSVTDCLSEDAYCAMTAVVFWPVFLICSKAWPL